MYSFSLKTIGKERPPCSPKAGPLWKQTSISRALLSTSFGVPSKGALPPGSPQRTPSERDDAVDVLVWKRDDAVDVLVWKRDDAVDVLVWKRDDAVDVLVWKRDDAVDVLVWKRDDAVDVLVWNQMEIENK
jgi:hypothetical protein